MSRQRDGQVIWHKGEFKNPEDATVNVLTHSLHYGSAVFEGTRVYETPKGPAVFRLDDHINRLFYSADSLGMDLPSNKSDIRDITLDLVRRNGFQSCYLRHLAYYGYGNLRVMPADDVPIEMAIACWPWGTYLSDAPIDINISSYIRIHPKSTVCDAKIAGHYVNCILSGLKIKGTHYKESLFLDDDDNVCEVGSANFFIVKDGKIYTPPLGTILAGITRNTLIEVARKLGYEVFEQHIRVDDILNADEAFLSGTAAEVTFVGTIDDKQIGTPDQNPVALKLREAYMAIVEGHDPEFEHYLTYVNEE
ncbi:MAG: branched chain amino acid aminotransferase [Coxiella sp. (in: Bacteria)]|nr:MAG: branched chain amino acid aminotransferase [Coxiella sp. (in: g-proteobacteria)]